MPPEHDIVAALRAENAALRAQVAQLTRAVEALTAALGGPARTAAPSMTLASLWDRYLLWARGERRDGTVATMRSRMRLLLVDLGARPVASLEWSDLDAYKARRRSQHTTRKATVADSTLREELTVMLSMLNWAVKRKHISANPLAGYELDDATPKRRKVYTEREVWDVLKASPTPYLRALVLCIVDGAMRPSEVLKLERDQLDEATGAVVVRAEQAKNGKERETAISRRALDAIRDLPTWPKRHQYIFANLATGKPYRYHAARAWWMTAREAAGVRPLQGECTVRLYDLRHTFATRALNANIPVPVVAGMMGHQSWQTLAETYYQPSTDKKLEAIAKLEQRNFDEQWGEKRHGPMQSSAVAESGSNTDVRKKNGRR